MVPGRCQYKSCFKINFSQIIAPVYTRGALNKYVDTLFTINTNTLPSISIHPLSLSPTNSNTAAPNCIDRKTNLPLPTNKCEINFIEQVVSDL